MAQDYILILKALKEIPFGVGKKLLIDFLQGKEKNKSIERNQLHRCEHFGCLVHGKEDIAPVINNLIMNNLIRLRAIEGKKFWKVMELTEKGRKEIDSPSLHKRRLSYGLKESRTIITDQDRVMFDALPFLNKYNDNQKKSIICKNPRILCIAGAGSGKTTVLTQRIAFLVKYCSQAPEKILAVTFTKKAREEMRSRINNNVVSVETFNSFCEKILRQHNDLIYDRPVRVLSYRDKIVIIREALASLDIPMTEAIDTYFSWAQRRGKTEEKLANIFLNDIFFLRDYFKFKNLPIDSDSFEVSAEHEKSLRMVMSIGKYVEAHMKKHGYRDFADQLLDTLSLFSRHRDVIPEFDHVLIDEYQDINSTQIELIDTLAADNLFCVGDPRQSIFGWRGSDIKYILNFEDKYPGCEITTLTENYRSTEHIVRLINSSIKDMGLADLDSNVQGEKDIQLTKFSSQDSEFRFIIDEILSSHLPRNEIFVLARTNRLLKDLSTLLKQKDIKHVTRSDDARRSVLAQDDELTLATIHAIKGMEAEMVFVMGCTPNNFPCKGSEHPVMDLVKIDEYDKEEEEKRLLYVAMSRARRTLHLTYPKSHTYFITDQMASLIRGSGFQQKTAPEASNDLLARLKEWRTAVSESSHLRAYQVMHDRTLIAISAQMPRDSTELQRIHGMGPAKIFKYGDEILDIVYGK